MSFSIEFNQEASGRWMDEISNEPLLVGNGATVRKGLLRLEGLTAGSQACRSADGFRAWQNQRHDVR